MLEVLTVVNYGLSMTKIPSHDVGRWPVCWTMTGPDGRRTAGGGLQQSPGAANVSINLCMPLHEIKRGGNRLNSNL
jgi:hypothetical protein